MGAIRTARGYTKRNRIAFVEGAFHGLFDKDVESGRWVGIQTPKFPQQ